jgi:replicative DNA helicase
MANFGQETIGVFNKEFIDRAKRRYAYVESVNYKAVRVIGVDWDKYSSTPQIIVLEYDPTATNSHGDKGMFKVIMRDSVPRSDFTLDNAVNKIVEFNGIYRPAYIYVDRGFGEYQLEILHKKGKECKDPTAPEFGLDKIAKGIHFGSKIDLRDPGTGEVVKKDVKPFMVGQTNILLERDRIILNENDKVLWRQMENYQVVKVSVDGKPTYTSVNEHALDALMLSVLAMTLEFPELAKIVQKFEPNRSMALASAIPRPEASFGEKNRSNREEKEYFMTSKMRENNSQTWNKVDDLRKSKRDRRGGSFMRGTIAPRGRSQKKPFSRPKF